MEWRAFFAFETSRDLALTRKLACCRDFIFSKNHDQDSRWPNGGIGYDIRDDQIWMYFTTGIDENNTYYDEYTEENYPDRVGI